MQKFQIAFLCLLFAVAGSGARAREKHVILNMPVHNSIGSLWLGKDGQLHGPRIKLVRVLNQELRSEGIQFRYVVTKQGELPIIRCLHELVAGQYDAYLELGYSEKRRDMGILYSKEPIYTFPEVVWMRKGYTFPINGPASLKGKRIGVLQGAPILTNPLEAQGILIDRSDPTVKNNLMKLINGRIDAFIDPINRTGTVVLELGLKDRIAFCLTCMPPSQSFVGYAPGVPEDVRIAVDNAIKRLHYSGKIQRIMVGDVLDKLTH